MQPFALGRVLGFFWPSWQSSFLPSWFEALEFGVRASGLGLQRLQAILLGVVSGSLPFPAHCLGLFGQGTQLPYTSFMVTLVASLTESLTEPLQPYSNPYSNA